MAMSLRYSTIVISWEDFMNEFVPEPDISKPEYPFDTFSPFSGPRCEEGFLVSLTEAVNHRDLCPGYTFLHSSRNNANQYCDNGKPACYGMVRKGEPSTNLYEPIDWSNVEVPIECRAAEPNEDPFSEQRPNMQMHAENQEDSLHQIFWFIHEIFARQHRVFLFAVFILGPHARVLRADRSGIFSTEWINCTTAGGRLAEFFWRVSCLSPAERGHDPTAERVLYDSPYANMLKAAERALDKNDYLHSLFKTTLDPNWPWWLLRFEDEGARKLRTFVVGKPHFVSSDIAPWYT
ncbi:hypothetical protein C8Q78DRAFT_545890 [Trametes maxima]|nr:hypothetical protein C8Q78DRAFT_545890 [Trametes maxima]